MILTCPECATSYFVDDDRIPAAGRSVKCSSCGNRWRAMPEGVTEPELQPRPAPITDAALEAEEPALDAGDDDIEFVPAAARTRGAKAKASSKGGSRGLVVGVVLLAVLAAGAGAVAAFREQVAGMVPGTAPLFAAVGLPVNTLGLTFEGVAWKPAFLAGRPVMAVTGAIRNTTEAPIDAPTVRVSLQDDKKALLRAYDLAVTNGRVPPGGLRYFAWNLPDPPAGAHNLVIGFNPAAARPAEAHAAAEPAEAKALAPESPDALAHHE